VVYLFLLGINPLENSIIALALLVFDCYFGNENYLLDITILKFHSLYPHSVEKGIVMYLVSHLSLKILRT
jgi:hypothetical protein